MENFEEYDVGDNDFLVQELLQELSTEGFDCASVDVLLRMARDGEIDSFADVLGALVVAGHANWSGEILRMTMLPPKPSGSEPNYSIASGVLSYLVDMGHVDWAYKMCPHVLVQQANGPDCYDLAFTFGHMVMSYKAKQAAQLMMAIYSDESPAGQSFRPIVPCMLGTLIDFQQAPWATDVIRQLCLINGQPPGQPDYKVAGWCLAQQVYFGRADWAARICNLLRQQQPPWYSEPGLFQSISTWGGEGYARDISNCMASRMP